MSKLTYHPQRGDFVHLNLSPSAGHEMADPHYGLVLTPLKYNRASGMAVVCAITSTIRNYPFEVRLPKGLLPPKDGKLIESVVLADAVRQIDYRERGVRFVAACPRELLEEVIEKLLTLIDPGLLQGE